MNQPRGDGEKVPVPTCGTCRKYELVQECTKYEECKWNMLKTLGHLYINNIVNDACMIFKNFEKQTFHIPCGMNVTDM